MPTCWAMVRKTSPWLRGLDEAPTFTGFVRSSFEAGRAAAFFATFVAILATPLAWRCSLQPIGCEHEKRKRDSRPGSAYRGRRSCATGAAAEALLRGRPRESAGQYQLRGRGVTSPPWEPVDLSAPEGGAAGSDLTCPITNFPSRKHTMSRSVSGSFPSVSS